MIATRSIKIENVIVEQNTVGATMFGANTLQSVNTSDSGVPFAQYETAMSMGGGSENDSADMGQYIQNIFALKAQYNCHVMIIHHSGKDKSKGSRGHSSLRAAVDTEIQVSDDGSFRTATCKKQRDMENGKQVAFTLRGVDLGLDDENDPITSCIVEHANVDLASLTKSQPLKGNTLIAKQALHEAIGKHGRRMADTENYPASRRVVSVDVWRAEFFKMRIESGVKKASIMKDYGRQAEALEASDLVRCYSGMVWFVHDEDRQDIIKRTQDLLSSVQ